MKVPDVMTTFAEAAADVAEEAIAPWVEVSGVDDTLVARAADTGADAMPVAVAVAVPVPVPDAFPESTPKPSSSSSLS